jgi:hypothetical protein
MPASLEVRQGYFNAINTIWKSSIGDNNVNNISDEVISFVDKTLTQISTCSKGYLAMDLTFAIFYSPPSSWAAIISTTAQNTVSVNGWLDALSGNKQYLACINTAANSNKSDVARALVGY